MSRPGTFRASIITASLFFVCLGFLGTSALHATAAEPADEFLEKLTEQGYFDIVQVYIEQLKTRGIKLNSGDSFEALQVINLAQLANQERDPKKQQLLADAAKSQLRAFIAKNPKNPATAEAKGWIRKFVFNQAMGKVVAARAVLDEEKKKTILSEGVALFAEAQSVADGEVESLKQKNLEFRKQPKDKRDPDESLALKSEYLAAKITSARVLYMSAATLEFEPAKRKERLKAAAEAGKQISEKYDGTFAAHGDLIHGKALKDLGKHKEAIEILGELADSSDPAARSLAAEAASHTIDSQVETDAIDEGIALGKKWVEEAGANATDPLIQAIKISTARAYSRKANDASGTEQKKAAAETRRLIQKIARSPGRQQKEAKDILAQLPGDAAAEPTAMVAVDELRTYADAKAAGDAATTEVQTAQQVLGVTRGRMARAKGADKAKFEQEAATLEKTVASEGQKVIQYYRQAIRLAPADTDPTVLNQMRMVSCLSYYANKDYLSAAVIGEFIARRFADGPNARRAANLAMFSYLSLHKEAEANGNLQEAEFANAKVINVADYLSATWPEQPEAHEALITLVQFMIKQNKLAKAQEYLARIPDSSPRRGQADLVTGQAFWTKYREGMKAANGAATPELESLKKQAQAVLQGGVDRLKKAGPSPQLASAMLTLAGIYNESSEPQKALALLNDQKVGPVTLVDKKHPATQAKNFGAVCYKTLLQAQLGSIATAKDKKGAMKDAEATMAKMSALYGTDDVGKKRLVTTYRKMAAELREQLDIAPANQKATLAQGFDAFLAQVQKATDEFNVLYWVAESRYSLGEAFTGPNGTVTAPAKQYFSGAAGAYTDILTRAEAGKLKLPDNLATQVRMKAAATKAQLGDFDSAVGEFTKILERNSMMLNIQIEAAKALKSGGIAKNDVEMLTKAIKGTANNPTTRKNTIWGWERIGTLTRSKITKSKSMKNAFFQARYNCAHCRYLQFKANNDTKYEDSARNILLRFQSSYPDLGGAEWKPKFEKLLNAVNATAAAAP